jgi:hypothetical protein
MDPDRSLGRVASGILLEKLHSKVMARALMSTRVKPGMRLEWRVRDHQTHLRQRPRPSRLEVRPSQRCRPKRTGIGEFDWLG